MSHLSDDERAVYNQEVVAFRRQKDEFFATSTDSPIPDQERQAGFSGLRYYPPDAALRVEASLSTFDTPATVTLTTSTGDLRRYLRYGEARFRIAGEDLRLVVFKQEAHDVEVFIPFKDATSGKETYGAGRYLEAIDDPHQAGSHVIELDFNLAYNPWCAYSDDYNCPLPPAENVLSFPITAGELSYATPH